jgi:hypothetical protein
MFRSADRALPPRGTCTLRDAVAVDQRLREAGPSLRYYGTRKHTARERVRGELLAEAADGTVVTDADVFGAALLADLAAAAAGADTGTHD